MTGDFDQKGIAVDGSDNFSAGTDTGKRPRLLSPNHLVRAVNITVRGGEVSNRPGFKKVDLSFDSTATQTAFETGLFQRAAFFSNSNHEKPMLVASISGKMIRFVLSPAGVTVDMPTITPTTAPNNSKLTRAWFCVADNYLILQDGQSKPIVYDGSQPVRIHTSSQVPVGTIMAAGQGRLFVKVGDRAIRAGDITGTGVGSILFFTETNFLNEGGDFGPPASQGEINSLGFMAVQDAATGQGALLSMGANGATSYNVQNDRSTWKNSPFAATALTERGSLGHESVVSANGDLWFRAIDGWRSYRSARAEITRWPRTTMSNEVNHRITDESTPLLDYGSAVFFDNRILSTCMPVQSPLGVYHLGLLALDFFPISSIRQLSEFNPYTYSSPAWEDLWTGIQPFQIISGQVFGEDRCFAFCYDHGKIALYEITKSDPFDNFGTHDQPISSSIEFPAYFVKTQAELKQLFGMHLGLAGYRGDVVVTANYRPDEHPEWFKWGTRTLRSKYKPEESEGLFALDKYTPPDVPRFSFASPPAVDVLSTGKKSDRGYLFQVKLEITGAFSISWIRLLGRRVMETLRSDVYGEITKS